VDSQRFTALNVPMSDRLTERAPIDSEIQIHKDAQEKLSPYFVKEATLQRGLKAAA
jgi:hypothetical protein